MKTKRFLSLFLCIAMTLSVLTGVTTNDRAAEEKRLNIANGNICIEAGVEANTVKVKQGDVTSYIASDVPICITGESISTSESVINTVIVNLPKDSPQITLVLDELKIDADSTTNAGKTLAPISIQGGSDVKVVLRGASELRGGTKAAAAGIQVRSTLTDACPNVVFCGENDEASLKIILGYNSIGIGNYEQSSETTGDITFESGKYDIDGTSSSTINRASGIGGRKKTVDGVDYGGNFTFNGGTFSIALRTEGAAIGGSGNYQTITINGGDFTINKTGLSTGIGAWWLCSNNGVISITGGTIRINDNETRSGKSTGAGIGGGGENEMDTTNQTDGGVINISGGDITFNWNNTKAACIGGSGYAGQINISGGSLKFSSNQEKYTAIGGRSESNSTDSYICITGGVFDFGIDEFDLVKDLEDDVVLVNPTPKDAVTGGQDCVPVSPCVEGLYADANNDHEISSVVLSNGKSYEVGSFKLSDSETQFFYIPADVHIAEFESSTLCKYYKKASASGSIRKDILIPYLQPTVENSSYTLPTRNQEEAATFLVFAEKSSSFEGACELFMDEACTVSAENYTLSYFKSFQDNGTTRRYSITITPKNGWPITSPVKLYFKIGDDECAYFSPVELTIGVPAPTNTPTPTSTPTPTPGSVLGEDRVREFVTRCYQITLGRAPETAGCNDWTNKLVSKEVTGISCAYGFIYSAEYQSRSMSNAEYVENLYQLFFNRESDGPGFATWYNGLESGQLTREDVFQGFANSVEFYDLCKSFGIVAGTYQMGKDFMCTSKIDFFVYRLYTIALGRSEDRMGMYNWSHALSYGSMDGANVAYGFFFSSEFLAQNNTKEEYLTRLYRTFMNREPDAEGMANWMAVLENDTIENRKIVFNGFAQSTEFNQICQSYGITAGHI